MTPQGNPVLAGEIVKGRSRGSFTYADSWLSHPDRYPLDPVNAPLSPVPVYCDHNDGVLPVFSDAAPDAWGTRILLLRHRSQPRNEIERLLLTSGRGVGTLQFSLSQSRPKRVDAAQDIRVLRDLYTAAESIDERMEPDEEALRLMEPGSSMGGARPKSSVTDGKTHYIAKFLKHSDLVDVPRVEYATMRLLSQTELDVPAVRIESVGRGRSAYLIERFDIRAGLKTHHYVSAHALFNMAKYRELPDGRRDPAGYVALAHHIRAHCASPAKDTRQLFLRALTNIALGNTDDHARNFGLCYDLNAKQWSLAPVFDVLPIVGAIGQSQAMSLGVKGRESSWENLLSCCESFGLSEAQATRLAMTHLAQLSDWELRFRDASVTAGDIRLLRSVIKPRMEAIQAQCASTSI